MTQLRRIFANRLETLTPLFQRFKAISLGDPVPSGNSPPILFSGSGAPDTSLPSGSTPSTIPSGSLYVRWDATADAGLYQWDGSAWTAFEAGGGAGSFTTLSVSSTSTFTGLLTANGGLSGVIGATGPAAGTFTAATATSLDLNGTMDHDAALTGTGDGINSLTTISHATQLAEGIDASVQQVTNSRTGGRAVAVQGTAIGLAGDTSGASYNAFNAVYTANTGSGVAYAYRVAAGWTGALDLSAAATGEAKFLLPPNVAIGFDLADATGSYLHAVTTTGLRYSAWQRPWRHAPVQTVSMGDAAHALVWGTAGAGQSSVTSNLIGVDAGGATTRALTLPSAAAGASAGAELTLRNVGAAVITLADASSLALFPGSTVTVIATSSGWIAAPAVGAQFVAGTIAVAIGQATGTANVGAAYDGKPVVATVMQAAADATFVNVLRANISGGTLTVYGPAAATAETIVAYWIDGR